MVLDHDAVRMCHDMTRKHASRPDSEVECLALGPSPWMPAFHAVDKRRCDLLLSRQSAYTPFFDGRKARQREVLQRSLELDAKRR